MTTFLDYMDIAKDLKLVIHEVLDYRPAGYSLQQYTKTPTQTQNIDLDNLICFLFAMTVTSFINVGRACDPADTVTCNGLSYAWPRRLQHSLVNSSATASQWEGASRSEYGDASRRPAQSRQPISLCISVMWQDANGPNDALAYCRASERPTLWSTCTNWSWCNWNLMDEHHHKTADVRLQHPIKLFGVNMTGHSKPRNLSIL